MTYKILLYSHIITGMISFICGIMASFSTKGRPRHLKWGRGFAISLGISAVIALVLSFITENSFLLGIGLFTLYLLSSGWLWVTKHSIAKKQRLGRMIGIVGLLFAIYMLYTSYSSSTMSAVLAVFGGILVFFAGLDLIRTPDARNAIKFHGIRMGAAFIASITAFVVTNFAGYLPGTLTWLLPTIIGVPIIIMAIRKYYARLAGNSQLKGSR